jgi:allantoin racemase
LRVLMINPNTSAAVTEMLAARVREVVGRSATIVPVTARFGARYIASRAAAVIAGHAALDALAEHVANCDAVYLACFGDPGLAGLKEISPVPVVGMAEAALQSACALGDRFAIVTGGALWGPMLKELVVGLGLTDRLAAIRTVALSGDEIARDPDLALNDIATACDACATEDGADVVILGGAALCGVADRIRAAVPVPLICSVEAGSQAVVAACNRVQCIRSPPKTSSVGLTDALAKLLESP